MPLVTDHVPPPTRADRESWLLAAARHCLALGITGVHDAGVDPDNDEAYVTLAAARALPIRTYAMADLSHPGWRALVEQGVRPERNLYAMRAVKLFADGALGSRGAQLFEPYCDDHGNTGLEVQSDEELWTRGHAAASRGFQLCVHAIGDKANARVLDLFERLRASGHPLERPRLEHAQVLRPADFARVRQLGVVCAMQPVHATTDARFAERRLGEARLRGAYAWRSLSDAGVTVAFGSDFPVEPADPRAGFHAAIRREGPDREPRGGWRREESVSPLDALDAFTRRNAVASFREHDLGRVAPGLLADLTLLRDDPFAADEWLETRVLGTVVDGVPSA
jgi:predicted amidohydrolase YtcJ